MLTVYISRVFVGIVTLHRNNGNNEQIRKVCPMSCVIVFSCTISAARHGH